MLNSSLDNREQERRLFLSRMTAAFIGIFLLLAILVTRLFFLQVLENERHEAQSEKNRLEVLPIPPIRGLIYDRNGELLARNQPSYTLSIVAERADDIETLVREVSQLITLTDEHKERFFQRLSNYRRPFEPIPLKLKLSEEEIAIMAANRVFLEGVQVEAELIRQYPFDDAFAHVLGYVGRINEQELRDMKDQGRYAGTRFIGKQGVERQYENALLGQPGFQRVETNARGRILRVIEKEAPEPGANLHLYLDRQLQEKAVELLGNRRGSVVAIEPETGGILAMVSQPGFDPNLYVSGFPSSLYNELRDSGENPFLNRAIRGQYPAASTIKPFIGLAGVDQGFVTWDYSIRDYGWYQLPTDDRIYNDWKRGGHGRVNMTTAVAESCDVYFYELAYKMKLEAIHNILDQFGFGKVTTADVYNASAGINPSREWKKDRHGFSWYAGDTINLSIGQGYFLATPMQVAIATAVMANRGEWVTPRLLMHSNNEALLETIPEPPPDVHLNNDRNWDRMHNAMQEVVQSNRGTARGSGYDAPYDFAGKSGTAQVIAIERDEDGEPVEDVPDRFKDHAWFLSFAPLENPKIAIAVLVENGGGGSGVAAPIARALMDDYLLREDRR
ncbi:penicillin-binding protein 2 [Saccharospirillum salsuginis]|uniref:Peptidoglycan D,D-transpeptidase MrdA n=1 Tax=Saccharospirillum salsuginis TaxID=418750 RepID=A0A918KMM6_9GAMM|nr:penicillin-binding protein 2 [Saccharospirillum salsuginis]GGX69571.1 peptidoglycan glycosyltransferase [Saccharospirillum salsuginis]